MKFLLRWTARIFSALFIIGIAGICVVIGAIWYYGKDLPGTERLANYEPPMVSRVYAGNGLLIGEFAHERRIFVPHADIPKRVKQAFLSAEDKDFYKHPGIDYRGIGRAIVENARNFMGSRKRRPPGGSTITQQVAKNFLLTNEVSVERKIKEMILAFRIERTFSKDKILELYLNEISLGNRSFGVAAAAVTYFNKSLDELTLAEAAYFAALPKAPTRYSRDMKAAKIRRDWVIGRMLEDGYVTADEAKAAIATPIKFRRWNPSANAPAGFFVEEVRRELLKKYGEKQLEKGGLVVRSTLNPHFQKVAYAILRKGLIAYDRRHGWRGAFTNFTPGTDWAKKLAAFTKDRDNKKRPHPATLQAGWVMAIVLEIDEGDAKKRLPGSAKIGFADGTKGAIPLAEMTWARERKPEQLVGPAIKKVSQVLKVGDVIVVEPVAKTEKGKPYPKGTYGLRQVPDVQGALVALDPNTGRVLAMVGGYAFGDSHYNRATQAKRQPGSAFKPFVYLTAMDNGYTPSSVILDGPAVIGNYKPSNYDGKYLGLMTLRRGLEKSRNTMTVRLAQAIGMESVALTAETFGIGSNLPREFAMTLGAVETTVLKLTTAYAMLANGGKRLVPTVVDRIQDRFGKTLSRHDQRPCEVCRVPYEGQDMPELKDTRKQIADPRSVFQVVSMMQGVVTRGTGAYVAKVGKPIAGKTGTTNDFIDSWFVGFTPYLAVGVWVGFDTPRTLGRNETGGKIASIIFRDFMTEAVKDKPPVPFKVPPGMTMVRVNLETGGRPQAGDKKIIMEVFKSGTQPGAPGAPQQGRGLTRKTAPETGLGGHY